jgi:hypothetical protein
MSRVLTQAIRLVLNQLLSLKLYEDTQDGVFADSVLQSEYNVKAKNQEDSIGRIDFWLPGSRSNKQSFRHSAVGR